jgi:hypothetical protein
VVGEQPGGAGEQPRVAVLRAKFAVLRAKSLKCLQASWCSLRAKAFENWREKAFENLRAKRCTTEADFAGLASFLADPQQKPRLVTIGMLAQQLFGRQWLMT